jgi:hypothetical protein
MDKSYIVIPIYSDPFLHPLHSKNELSLLYTQEYDAKNKNLVGESKLISQFHPDCSDVLQDYSMISKNKGLIFTPDGKKLQPIFSDYKKVFCVNQAHWWIHGKPMDFEVRNNAIDFLSNKYYNVKKLNEIVPLIKHKEYCDEIRDIMVKFLNKELKDMVVGDGGWFDNGLLGEQAFYNIEKNGVKVSDDVCDIFDMRVKKHISDGKLYSNYNLFTTTGRPSNSFGTVNFAALPPEKRKAIVPENDYLVEFDFDAYHLRLIADLVGYHTFDETSVHQHLADWYGCTYKESKAKTFKLLYGGIDKKTREKVPFFNLVHNYINKKWNEINTHNLVYTDIYRRKLPYINYDDLNRNKLFNYLIQAFETESNINKILSVQDYLLGKAYDERVKKTKLVLYGYDSFLFDFAEQDGVETLKQIKKILEDRVNLPTNRVDYKPYFVTKSKMGLNYGEMQDITKRL